MTIPTAPPAYEFKETLLKVENVSVSYGGTPILRDLSLEIKNVTRPGMTQGQVVGLLGPSGMGKTTLFRVLAGLQKPDTGQVLVGEEGRPVERGTVGVVAQDYPLLMHRTVLGNLVVAARQGGITGQEAQDRSIAMLKRFGVEEQARKYPAQLSGGQRQRVAIAQQLMCSERFLLMDEPFSGLDVVALKRVSDLLCEVAASDELKTFVLVTHDVNAVLEVADTIWLMGRDRDEQGNVVPGARIHSTYNLMERGLAWRDDIAESPEYRALLREIREVFPRL